MRNSATRPGEPTHQTDDVILSADGVRLGYRGRVVLDGVNLEIRRGEFWFLIGPNGHGKTTLLQALMGRMRPIRGRVRVSDSRPLERRIGYVPQYCSLNPTLPTTVREFVSLGLVGLNVERGERTRRLGEALARVGLAGMTMHDYWSLSGGQRQRALVARALVRRPSILIADEPTSGLDLSVESALLESLAILNRSERLTIVMVAHDLAIAARYGTHVALVHNGRVEIGPAAELLRSERLERAYGVSVDVRQDSEGTVTVRLRSSGATS